MDTIFMNSKNSKQSIPHRLLLNLLDKINWKRTFELLTPETIKLRGSTKSKINKDKIGESVFHLEITEVVLVHCNIVNNNYQQNLRVFYTFVPNKSFDKLLDISPANFIFC